MNNIENRERPEKTFFGFFSYSDGKRCYCTVDGIRYECRSLREAVDIWNRMCLEKEKEK